MDIRKDREGNKSGNKRDVVTFPRDSAVMASASCSVFHWTILTCPHSAPCWPTAVRLGVVQVESGGLQQQQ